MSKVGTQKKWLNGDIVNAKDYRVERDQQNVAINDNADDIKDNLDAVEVIEGIIGVDGEDIILADFLNEYPLMSEAQQSDRLILQDGEVPNENYQITVENFSKLVQGIFKDVFDTAIDSCPDVNDLICTYPNDIPDPTIRTGWFASVLATETDWRWIVATNQWEDSGVKSAITRTEFDALEDRVDDLQLEVEAIEDSVGDPNGIAPLDINSKLPEANLPSGTKILKGDFGDTAGDLPSSGVAEGYTYRCDSDDYTSAEAGLTFNTNDTATWFGTLWVKNDASDSVLSVNSKTGDVVIDKADVGLGNADNTSDADKVISDATQTVLNQKENLSNKTTIISASPNDIKYPSEKAVRDYVENRATQFKFTDLNDSPSDYLDSAGFQVRVNDAEDGLNYVLGDNNTSTSVISGMQISKGATINDQDTITIQPGVYSIMDTSDPSIPKTIRIEYDGVVNFISPGLIACIDNGIITYISIDNVQTIICRNVDLTAEQRRGQCYLGLLSAFGDVNEDDEFIIDDVQSTPVVNGQPVNAVLDFHNKISLKTGLVYGGGIASNQFTLTAGSIVGHGLNYDINEVSPNIRVIDAQSPVVPTELYRDGSGGIVAVSNTNFDASKYDDGSGTLITMTGLQSSIHYMYFAGQGQTFIIRGQNVYATFELAKIANLDKTDIIDGYPAELFNNAVKRTAFIAKRDALDFTNTDDVLFYLLEGTSSASGGGIIANIDDTNVNVTTPSFNKITNSASTQRLVNEDIDGILVEIDGNKKNVLDPLWSEAERQQFYPSFDALDKSIGVDFNLTVDEPSVLIEDVNESLGRVTSVIANGHDQLVNNVNEFINWNTFDFTLKNKYQLYTADGIGNIIGRVDTDLKDDTEYTILSNVLENDLDNVQFRLLTGGDYDTTNVELELLFTGVFKKTFTTGTINTNRVTSFASLSSTSGTKIQLKLIIIEGDHTALTNDQAINIINNYDFGLIPTENPKLIRVGKNSFDKSKATLGERIDETNGNDVVSALSVRSDFIRVAKNTDYYFTGASSADGRWALYDINFVYITGDRTIATSEFTTDANTAFLKISELADRLDVLQIEEGTEATAYEAYSTEGFTVHDIFREIDDVKDELVIDAYGEYKIKRNIGEDIDNVVQNSTFAIGGTTGTTYNRFFIENLTNLLPIEPVVDDGVSIKGSLTIGNKVYSPIDYFSVNTPAEVDAAPFTFALRTNGEFYIISDEADSAIFNSTLLSNDVEFLFESALPILEDTVVSGQLFLTNGGTLINTSDTFLPDWVVRGSLNLGEKLDSIEVATVNNQEKIDQNINIEFNDSTIETSPVLSNIPKENSQINIQAESQETVNEVVNGGFDDGTNPWGPANSTLAVVNNVLQVTGLAGTDFQVFQSLDMDRDGNTSYFNGRVRTTDSGCTKLELITGGLAHTIIDNPVQNTWYNFSIKYTDVVNDDSGYILNIKATFPDTLNKVMEIDGLHGVFAVNMSEHGIEDYSEADMLQMTQDGYFEKRTTELDVVSRGINIFNKNTVEPGTLTVGDGSESDNPARQRSAYIPVKPLTEYTISTDSTTDVFVHQYHEDISGFGKAINPQIDTPDSFVTFITDADINFIRFRNNDGQVLDSVQVQSGGSITPYRDYIEPTIETITQDNLSASLPYIDSDTVIEIVNMKAPAKTINYNYSNTIAGSVENNSFATADNQRDIKKVKNDHKIDIEKNKNSIENNSNDIVGIKGKTDFITVTQPVDLDFMEDDIIDLENDKLDIAGDAMLGELNMSTNKIINIDLPTNSGDAVTKGYLEGIVLGLKVANGSLLDPAGETVIVDPSTYGGGEYKLVFRNFTTVNPIEIKPGTTFFDMAFAVNSAGSQSSGLTISSNISTSSTYNTPPKIYVNANHTFMAQDNIAPSDNSTSLTRRKDIRNAIIGETEIRIRGGYTGGFDWVLYKL